MNFHFPSPLAGVDNGVPLTGSVPPEVDAAVLSVGTADLRNLLYTFRHEEALSRNVDITLAFDCLKNFEQSALFLVLLIDSCISAQQNEKQQWQVHELFDLFYSPVISMQTFLKVKNACDRLYMHFETEDVWLSSPYAKMGLVLSEYSREHFSNLLGCLSEVTEDQQANLIRIARQYDALSGSALDDEAVAPAALRLPFRLTDPKRATQLAQAVRVRMRTGMNALTEQHTPKDLRIANPLRLDHPDVVRSTPALCGAGLHLARLFGSTVAEEGYKPAYPYSPDSYQPQDVTRECLNQLSECLQSLHHIVTCSPRRLTMRLHIESTASLCGRLGNWNMFPDESVDFDGHPPPVTCFDSIDVSGCVKTRADMLAALALCEPLLAPHPWAALHALLSSSPYAAPSAPLDALLFDRSLVFYLLAGLAPLEFLTNATAFSAADDVALREQLGPARYAAAVAGAAADAAPHDRTAVTWRRIEHCASPESPLNLYNYSVSAAVARQTLALLVREIPQTSHTLGSVNLAAAVLKLILRHVAAKYTAGELEWRSVYADFMAALPAVQTAEVAQLVAASGFHTESDAAAADEAVDSSKMTFVIVPIPVEKGSAEYAALFGTSCSTSSPRLTASITDNSSSEPAASTSTFTEVQSSWVTDLAGVGDIAAESVTTCVVRHTAYAPRLGGPIDATWKYIAGFWCHEGLLKGASHTITISSTSGPLASARVSRGVSATALFSCDAVRHFGVPYFPVKVYSSPADRASAPSSDNKARVRHVLDRPATGHSTLTSHIFLADAAARDLAAVFDAQKPLRVQRAENSEIVQLDAAKTSLQVHLNLPLAVAADGYQWEFDKSLGCISVTRALVSAPSAGPLADDYIYPVWVSPASLAPCTPDASLAPVISLSLPYVRISTLPIFPSDSPSTTAKAWLNSSTALQFSLPERREKAQLDALAEPGPPPSVRTALKDDIFLMFMTAGGLQWVHNGLYMLTLDRAIKAIVFTSSVRLHTATNTPVLDAAVIARDAMHPADVVRLNLCQPVEIPCSTASWAAWSAVLRAAAERVRTSAHRPDCLYRSATDSPALCACFVGADGLGADFVNIPTWPDLAKYATRVAIAPVYTSTFVEPVWTPAEAAPPSVSETDRCRKCNATAAAGGLKRCSGCKRVQYCSGECQKRDWKTHKVECYTWKQEEYMRDQMEAA